MSANLNIMLDIVDDPVLCVFKKATCFDGPFSHVGKVNVLAAGAAAAADDAAAGAAICCTGCCLLYALEN